MNFLFVCAYAAPYKWKFISSLEKNGDYLYTKNDYNRTKNIIENKYSLMMWTNKMLNIYEVEK